MYARIGAIAVAFTLAITGSANAQERFGALQGKVTDQQGSAVPGVTVLITNADTQAPRTVVTDSSGVFVAPDLPPGRYNLTFELTGFARVERPDVTVLVGRTFDVNAEMRVGQLTETVLVTGAATPLVDTRSTLIAHNVTAEEFDRIPKGRSFQSVATTAPSVIQGDIEGGFQVNGASGSENTFTVDGVATNSLLNGHSRQNAVFEYLDEVQVQTVGITAEHGGALGGVITAVTKSGGNVFRGEGHYYYQGSALSSGPVKRLVLSPSDDRTVQYIQDEQQPNHLQEVGGSLGGPIVRDHLFFFGSISPRFWNRTVNYKFSNGTDPGDVKFNQTIMSAYGKVSYATRRVRANVGVLWTPTDSTGTLPGCNGFGPNVQVNSKASYEPNETLGFEIEQRNLQGNVDFSLSNTSFVSVTAGRFHDNYNDTGFNRTTAFTYRTPSSTAFLPVPAQFAGGTNFNNTPEVEIVERDLTTQTFVKGDFNAVLTGAGTHAIKAGVGLRRNANDVNKRYPGGVLDIWWGQTFTSSVPGVGSATGAYGYYELTDFGTVGEASADIKHFYAQDQWSIGRLTVNLGIRTENEIIPSFRPDIRKEAVTFGWGDKLAPRLGAAYDLFGDRRAKLFGSYGRYFDWTKYGLSRGSFGGDIYHVFYHALDDPALLGTINTSNVVGRDLWNPSVPGAFRDRRIPNFDTVDPDLKPMSQDSVNVGFEYQLGRRSVLTVDWVHNNVVRTIEDLGVLVGGDEVYYYVNPGEGIAQTAGVDVSTSTATDPFPIPKPKRQYDALQVALNRRFFNNWFFGGSYVYSRLYGNYAGLANSDEIRTPASPTGYVFAVDQQSAGSYSRPGGNANRSWDIDEMLWDANGNLDPRGRLATDRPHVLKMYGSYLTRFGTQIGGTSSSAAARRSPPTSTR